MGSDQTDRSARAAAARRAWRRAKGRAGQTMARYPWLSYGIALWLVAIATLLGDLVHPLFSDANLVMIYLLAVVVAAVYLGRGPSILVALLSVAAFDFFFVLPTLTLAVSETQDLVTFAALLVVGLVISSLMARIRRQAEAAEHRAAQNAELYALSRDLAVAGGLETIIPAILLHLSQTFGRRAVIFLSTGEGLDPWAPAPEFEQDDQARQVAEWVYRHGREAGRGTDVFTSAGARYLPLKTARGVLGVLGVKPADSTSQLTAEQRELLSTFASQAALAIERAQLAEQARQAEVLSATEKLQTALLNSISHDLRTPLVSILGALSSLQEDGDGLDTANRRSLVDNARDEAERLNRLVGNLLEMSRIEAGALRVRRELYDVEDLIGAALERFGTRLAGRVVNVEVPAGLPLVPMDFVLMEQVLVNLIENAHKYSPAEAPITLLARVAEHKALLAVADRGSGIPAGDLHRVFDKFYRIQRPGQVGGTGLGLSICKGIVEAHGGRIWGQGRNDGGTTIVVALPLEMEEMAA